MTLPLSPTTPEVSSMIQNPTATAAAGAGLWLCLLSLHLRGHKLSDVMDLGPIRWFA